MKRFDVAVIGGGPAGTTAARRLALLGHCVGLFHAAPSVDPADTRWESLSPGAEALLSRYHGDHGSRASGRALRGEARLRWSQDSGDGGMRSSAVVERADFDRELRASAVSAGVELVPANVRVTPSGNPSSAPPTLHSADSGQPLATCRFLIDAGGRRTVLSGKRKALGEPLFALQAHLHGNHLPAGHTHLEAGPDWWLWSAGIGDGMAVAQVFVDPTTLRRDVASVFENRLRSSSLFGPGGWSLATPCRVREATPRAASVVLTRRSLKAGDAALALDPLSSQGLQHALNNAGQSAVMVNTLLRRPENEAMVRRFCRERHAEAIENHRISCATFYGQQALFSSSFWTRRSAPASLVQAPTPPPPQRMIRMDAPIALAPAAEWRLDAVLAGDFIEEVPVLYHAALARQVGFIEGVLLHDLLTPLSGQSTGRTLLERWNREGKLEGDKPERLLSLLITRGVLCASGLQTTERPDLTPRAGRLHHYVGSG
jgi:2-polyprenyl-6-methoxyphenol hydroxylase-like FAD-dependent oxidoreductase